MIDELERRFKEKGWIKADLNYTELKQFLKDVFGVDEDLPEPELGSLIFISNYGSIEYFSNGKRIVIKPPNSDNEIQRKILEWLIKNNVYWDFLLW